MVSFAAYSKNNQSSTKVSSKVSSNPRNRRHSPLTYLGQLTYFRKMADPKLCLRNKFGYCKFNQHCQLRHNNDNCAAVNCDIKDCDKRHPKECWWYNQFKRCKFAFCSYKHVEKDNHKDFKLKIEVLERKIQEKDDEMKTQMEKINEIERTLKQNELETRVKYLEKFVLVLQENLEKKDKDENYLARWNPEGNGWTILDPLVRRESLEHKCNECEYVGRNPSRLKLHKEVKHMNLCTICPDDEQLFETKEELQKHTSMVHDNLDQVLSQDDFDNLSEHDSDILRFGGDDTPRRRDAREKYTLRTRKLKY